VPHPPRLDSDPSSPTGHLRPLRLPVTSWQGAEGHDRLEAWRANVGPPVALDRAPRSPMVPDRLLVLSWNLWIGRGHLTAVVEKVRQTIDAPLVILAQEAYRAGDMVPHRAAGRRARRAAGGFPPRPRRRTDIVEAADSLGLNLRYVPSMRNGAGRSDRGNAILSDLPLADASGVELPLVLQRRVAVAATILLPTGPLRVASAHLDPRGPPGAAWLGTAGRARQAAYLLAHLPADPLILGADLNLGRGRRERAWHLLTAAGLAAGVPAAVPAWRHTFHALPRLVLDYLLVRDGHCRIASAHVERVDEHPHDRGPTVYGSDHHPLLARVALHHRPEAA
jgi:endonuclease/exonuclease/phosphatase family metal-dependent hydrolase